jgi:hypothetical protein
VSCSAADAPPKGADAGGLGDGGLGDGRDADGEPASAAGYRWMMTGVPMTTRVKSCTASQLNMRMQPCEA